jgi:hypothetical protein
VGDRVSARATENRAAYGSDPEEDIRRKESPRSPQKSRSSEPLLGASSGQDTTWLVAIFFVLLLSAALNLYLFWLAHEARVRYQVLLEKYRESGEPVVDVA